MASQHRVDGIQTRSLDWYGRDADVEARLPELTTYLGDAHVSETYWYVSAEWGQDRARAFDTIRWEKLIPSANTWVKSTHMAAID
jgi:hypothetical protein